MCGIYMAIEKGGFQKSLCDGKCATKIIFEGLKDVEYRGYDNWGMAVWGEIPQEEILVGYQEYNDSGLLIPEKKYGLLVEKRAGKMPEETTLPCSHIGLGHTRWATHGGATDENSHPFIDCHGKLAIVVNGMIENHEQLWAELEGHKRRSQTDSELIVHHIEKERLLHPDMPLALALRKVHRRLQGNNAVFVTDGHIIAGTTYGSPMVVGKTETGIVGSSDELALVRYTNMTHTLANGELIVANEHNITYGTEEPYRIRPIPFKQNAQEKPETLSKEDFNTFMEKEIVETPSVLERMLEETKGQRKEVAKILNETIIPTIIGCGTASFAAEIFGKLMYEVAKKRNTVIPASEMHNMHGVLDETDTIVAFSQSGTTIDILDETRFAQSRGAKVVSFVNVRNSALDQESNARVHLKSGTEKAVLATKSFSTMLGASLLTAYEMAGKSEEGERILRENIKAARDVIHRRDEIKNIVDQINLDQQMFASGRGLSASISKEAALKGSEGAYVSLQGFPGGEFKHGMMAVIDEEKGTPMFAIHPNDELSEEMKSNIIQVRSRGGKIIGFGPQNQDYYDYHILVPEAGASSIIANAVAVQLVGLYMAEKQGFDPDKPRNLAKSVTVK